MNNVNKNVNNTQGSSQEFVKEYTEGKWGGGGGSRG